MLDKMILTLLIQYICFFNVIILVLCLDVQFNYSYITNQNYNNVNNDSCEFIYQNKVNNKNVILNHALSMSSNDNKCKYIGQYVVNSFVSNSKCTENCMNYNKKILKIHNSENQYCNAFNVLPCKSYEYENIKAVNCDNSSSISICLLLH